MSKEKEENMTRTFCVREQCIREPRKEMRRVNANVEHSISVYIGRGQIPKMAVLSERQLDISVWIGPACPQISKICPGSWIRLFLEKKKCLSDSGIWTQFPSRLCICVAMKVDVTKVDTLISQECEDMTRYDTSTALGTYQWTGRLHTHFPILNSA